MNIHTLTAREILDSRGNPTLEVVCVLEGGQRGVASVPSGASTGAHEAVELRDGDMHRFRGHGVRTAINHVQTTILQHVHGVGHTQQTLDEALITLDGTPNKSRLGANATLGVSCAFARAAALVHEQHLYEYIASIAGNTAPLKLPMPMFNIINGGKHADSGLDVQEFMVTPRGIEGFEQQLQAASEITHALRGLLHEKGYSVGVGDEGGFAPRLASNEEALQYIVEAIAAAGYSHDEVQIAMDVAASSLYSDKTCTLKIDGTVQCIAPEELITWYKDLITRYPIVSIEDGLPEDDWEGFAKLTATLGDKILVVGDDLTVTNTARITTAHEKQAINSVLIKLNQIGTLTETIRAVQLTQSYGWKPFVSHRSGETTDAYIADLAVGLGCPYIKAGAPVRGERVAKYNRLLDINRHLA